MSGEDKWDADYQQSTLSMGLGSHQWEGEDEDDIKDSWDDPEEDESEKKEEEEEAAALKAKNEKLKEEKRKKMLAEKEKALKNQKRLEDMTPEERLAEKLKRQKLQEESDLQISKELLGYEDDKEKNVADSSENDDSVVEIPKKDAIKSPVKVNDRNESEPVNDKFDPFVLKISDPYPQKELKTKSDFENYKDEIVDRISGAPRNEHFTEFVNKLIQSLCTYLPTAEVKNLHTSIGNLHTEKMKLDQGKTKKKAKPTIKAVHSDDEYDDFYEQDDIYDDYM